MNRCLWPFPIFGGSGKPLGDGIYWPTNRPEEEGASASGSNKVGAASANKRQNSITSPESLVTDNRTTLGNAETYENVDRRKRNRKKYPKYSTDQGIA